MVNKTEYFIDKANTLHSKKYGYDKTVYVKSNEKVIITCFEHGDFTQSPSKHLSGRGCPECARKTRADKRRLKFDSFVLRANKIHGNKYSYEYNELKSGNRTYINIVCPTHGVFEQVVSSHLSGYGCPKCAGNIQKTTDEFIADSRSTHGEIYDYSESIYSGANKKVKIICPEHGAFEQTPDNHINGKQGCPFCGSSGSYNLTYFEKNKEEKTKNAKLYVVSFTSGNENFIKVGITKKNTRKRFPKAKRNGYNISTIIEKETTLYDAWKIEQIILSKFKGSKYAPLLPFPGHTETLNSLILVDVMMTIEEYL